MSDYEIVIHLRESAEPTRIALPGVAEDDAEADRQRWLYELEQARFAEAPVVSLQTTGGLPPDGFAVDPHDVTGIDLVEADDVHDRDSDR